MAMPRIGARWNHSRVKAALIWVVCFVPFHFLFRMASHYSSQSPAPNQSTGRSSAAVWKCVSLQFLLRSRKPIICISSLRRRDRSCRYWMPFESWIGWFRLQLMFFSVSGRSSEGQIPSPFVQIETILALFIL
ncbi:hypothetical protein NL676_028953 [Syzygium grande]|nr:hypothetical protein NL676_028953 [Syzygium grande]